MTIQDCRERFASKHCTVLGIGVSNLPLCRFLVKLGAKVSARDRKSLSELGDTAKELQALGVTLLTGEGYLQDIHADYLFRSPGIRPDRPEILAALAEGATLLSEMELFFELCPCPILAVTGSDGKTTTTTLISLLLRAAGKTVYVGGNIGTPLLPLVEQMRPEDYAVVELSSFQLMTLRRPATVAVITNLSPNHLDWHTGMEEYVDSKQNIYRGEGCRRVVLNAENDGTAKIAAELMQNGQPPVLRFSKAPLQGEQDISVKSGSICRGDTPILPIEEILLPGSHNVENYMAAIAAVGESVPDDCIRQVASSFPGVEHRIEFVREWKGVRFYNSSIDSSPSRTAAALHAFAQKLIVICGGYDKHIPFAPLGEVLCEKASAVVLTGATKDAIRAAIEDCTAKEKPVLYTEPSFDDAVRRAAAVARPGDTVILSPGCASFDAFPNFMVRGNHFKTLVNGL